ncbi:hypothetical protein RHMOL_Rhmol08G0236100 [Rhododendron molle]|uniref:Uncharacterized protein n=1 Tax=Rhododendron molle TaxID=49168 RepID=A0ACC0MT54_RHOML|nr:hypothetical protein RHMOL_Rhmol08G0236100 [Rhododendron molle]
MLAVEPGFKGPSYHDMRCPLLNNSVREIKEYLLELRESIDTSGLVKDADTLFGIFCGIVELVGPSNVVQFITDNEAAYKATGKRLQAHYGSFYWSPCAAHCLDLMLENFAKPQHFPHIDATNQKAKKVTPYIYNHAWVLNTMRKDFTNGRDLCRPGITSEPLVRVLRLTDGDERPVMGYLYEAMDKAKEAIKVRLNNRLSLYGPNIQVIDARWDRQLGSPLHAAGCFLNPGIYFMPSITKKKKVARGMIQALTVLVPDEHLQDQISAQIEEYKQATGDFNMPVAIRQREKLPPGNLLSSLFQYAYFILIIRRTKDALDPISIENIDVLDDWVSEEPSLLDEEDIAWEIIEPPSLEALTLDDQEPNFDDAADYFPNENESQYDYWDNGGHNDPYVYVE